MLLREAITTPQQDGLWPHLHTFTPARIGECFTYECCRCGTRRIIGKGKPLPDLDWLRSGEWSDEEGTMCG